MSFFRNIGHRQSRRLASLPTPDPTPLTPLHERQLDVNPQKDSLFYNGTIPAEIRDQIFYHSVQEFLQTDKSSVWPLDTRYNRPGYSSKRNVNISLLLTCRRIYLETYRLPVTKREHYFFHAGETAPPHQGHRPHSPFGYNIEIQYFSRFQPWQLALVKEIHLFTQMFWLEYTFQKLCQQDFMRNVERLKITLRRGDWWFNEQNHSLVINPHRDTVKHDFSVAQMHSDIASQARGEVVPYHDRAWGLAFKHLPSLKELEIEFETSDDKKPELDTILKWAKTWKFPMNNGLVLSAEGLDMTSTSWQSPYCYWSDLCPYCGSPSRQHCNSEGTPNEAKCAERATLRFMGLGPKCYTYGLKWRVVQDENAPGFEHPVLQYLDDQQLSLQDLPVQQHILPHHDPPQQDPTLHPPL